MHSSQMELHLARQTAVIRAVETGARQLLSATRALVTPGWSEPEQRAHRRAEIARSRRALVDVLDEERLHVHALVASQARALVERLHEAELEHDLAVTLGSADMMGRDALVRAQTAVGRDGRALHRALLHLTAFFLRPEEDLDEGRV